MIERMREGVFDALSPRLYYGWVVLGVAGLGIFASGPGQSHTFSVFVGPIAEDLGITAADVASAYAFATLAASFLLPYMGRMVDRHGPRRMTALVAAALGLACIVFGATPNLLILGLAFAALRFLGQGSLMLNSANLVSQWFDRKRGTAMSLMALGFAASMAVHPALGQLLLEQLGWRLAWVALGLLTWLLLLPPVLLLLYDKPEDKGLLPDGDAAPDTPEGEAAGASKALVGLTLNEAMRTPAFYILCVSLFSISMLITVLHFYQVAVFEEHGLSARVASSVFAVSAATMVLTMPLVGRLLDRLPTRIVFAMALVVTAASLLLATRITGLPTALVYAAVFGLNNAFSITLFGYIWPRYFGRRHVGSVQGAGQMIAVVGASLGPPLIGYAEQAAGGFATPLAIAAAFPIACAVMSALFLRTPAAVAVGLERD